MERKRKRRYIIWGSILLVLIVARLLLPFFVLKYANRSLAEMKGYYGHVDDIDISLYRGAYQINNIFINKIDSPSGRQVEFFNSRKVDLSIAWRPLFHGKLVGNMEFLSPRLVFTKDKAEPGQVVRDTNDFRKVLRDFMPLKVNRFEINDGSIHYIDNSTSPRLDMFLKNAHILAQNLKNTNESHEKLPSSVDARATLYGGEFTAKMKLDPFADDPTFDLTAEMTDADLTAVNDFFKAYLKFDVSGGTLALYAEFAAESGAFKGYIKPIIKKLKVKGTEDKNDNLYQKVKEDVISVAGKLVTNPVKKQIATKVPIEGRFDNPNVGSWEAVWEILKNAYIKALLPAIDDEINIQSVENDPPKEEKKGFFGRLFGGHKKDKGKD